MQKLQGQIQLNDLKSICLKMKSKIWFQINLQKLPETTRVILHSNMVLSPGLIIHLKVYEDLIKLHKLAGCAICAIDKGVPRPSTDQLIATCRTRYLAGQQHVFSSVDDLIRSKVWLAAGPPNHSIVYVQTHYILVRV